MPQCGLVNNWEGKKTFHNWEGLHTPSKKEKKKLINMWAKENANKLKCEQSLKLSFNAVTLKKASFILNQFQNNVLNATESRRFRYFPSWYEGPNGDFTVSRQTALANSSQSTVKNAG